MAELAARHGLPVDPRARVETLSVGAQQRVEILKALHRGARVLILDEPTAVLTPQEVDDLFRVLRDLQARGTGVVLITHKLAEVAALARRVTVMRAGRVVGGGPAADFPVGRMAELMVGRAIPALRPRSPRGERVPLLRVRMLDVLDDRDLPAVRRVSFDVHDGRDRRHRRRRGQRPARAGRVPGRPAARAPRRGRSSPTATSPRCRRAGGPRPDWPTSPATGCAAAWCRR